MSQTIENRIVEMQFENKQFESGVQESLSTLDKLKKSLNFDDSAKNLQNFSNSVTKNLDMHGIGAAVESLKDRFSASGIAGMEVIKRLTNFAIDAGKTIASALDAPFAIIRNKGWSRAMNIEDAKFQLKGLGIAWNDVSDDIDYAVADTAYGLDVAAKACAQLSASSVQAGADMKAALRGISGVAAMGNTEYENISRIFTKAAGNGKVMAQELNMVSQYGLNARASLRDFFNNVVEGNEKVKDIPEDLQKKVKNLTKGLKVSESDINEFVHKSKIDFRTFAYAMDSAFGEHAKKANETYFGALSNIKAALGKIGAEFATPLIQGAIPIFNQIRIFLNDLRKQMGPVFETFRRLTEIISDKLTKKLKDFRVALLGENGFGQPMQNLMTAFNNIKVAVIRIVAAISTAFKEVFPQTKNLSSSLLSVTEGIVKFTEKLIASDETLIVFKNIVALILNLLKNVGSVISFLLPVIGKVVSFVLTIINVIGNLLGYLVSLVFNLDIVKNTMNEIKKSGSLFTFVIDKLKMAFSTLKDVLTDTSTVTGRFFTSLRDGAVFVVSVIAGSLYVAFVKIKDVLSYFNTHDPLGSLVTGVKTLIEKLKELPVVKNIIHGIEVAFGAIGLAISKFVGLIKDFINNLKSGMSVIKAVGAAISSVFGGAITLIGSLIDKIRSMFSAFGEERVIEETIENPIYGAQNAMVGFEKTLSKTDKTVKQTSSGFGKAKDSISKFATGVLGSIKSIKPGQVLLFAFGTAISLLAVNLSKLVKSFAGLTTSLTRITNSFGAFLNGFFAKRTTFAEAMIAMSVAVGALAGSLYALAQISGPKLAQVTIALGSLLTVMGIFSVIGKNGAGPFAASMMAFSGGILMLVAALYAIDGINMNNIWTKVGVLASICGVMVVVSAILSKVAPSFSKGGLAIVAFAGSVYVLAKALDVLSHADLNNIKENWLELAAVIGAFAAFASIASNVGMAAALGLIGFIGVLKLLSASSDMIKRNFGSIENAFRTIVDALKGAIQYLYNGLKKAAEDMDKNETFAKMIQEGIGVVVASIIGLVLALGHAGKGLKKAAVGFALVAASIAGLMYVTAKIAEFVQMKNIDLSAATSMLKSIMIFISVLGGLSVLQTFIGGKFKTDDKFLKDIRKLLTSMGLLLLAIGAFSAMIGSLTEDEFNRVKTALIETEIVVGLIVAVATIITATATKAGKSEIGFSTFAGLVLLLGSLIGSIAVLMYMFSEVDWERDKQQLIAVSVAFGGMVVAICAILASLALLESQASKSGSWKAIALLGTFFGGLGVLMLEFAALVYLLAKKMADPGMMDRAKMIAIGIVGFLTVISVLAAALQAFSVKLLNTDMKQSAVTKMLGVLATLVGATIAFGVGLYAMQGVDAGRMWGQVTAIMFALTSVSALALAIATFAKDKRFSVTKRSQSNILKIFAMIGAFLVTFAALGLLFLGMSNVDAGRMWGQTTAITTTLIALTALAMGIITFVDKVQPGWASLGKAAAILGGMIGLFAILTTVFMIIDNFESSGGALIGKSQTIVLVMLELEILAAAAGALGMFSELIGPGELVLLGMVGLFAALSAVFLIIDSLKTEGIMKKSQTIVLVMLELEVLATLCSVLGALSPFIGLGELCLLGMVGLFAALSAVFLIIDSLKIEGIMKKSQTIVLVMLELEVLAAAAGVLGAFIPLIGAGELCLLGMVGLFAALSAVFLIIDGLKTEGIMKKSQTIVLVLLELEGLLLVLGILSPLATAAAAGIPGLLGVVLALGGIAAAIWLIADYDLSQIQGVIDVFISTLQKLMGIGVEGIIAGPGLLAIAAGITALGLACGVAGLALGVFATSVAQLAVSINALTATGPKITAWFTSISVGVTTLSVSIMTAVTGLSKSVVQAVNTLITGVIQALTNGGVMIFGAAVLIGNKIIEGIKSTFKEIVKIPGDIVKALVSGIKSIAGKIIDAGRSMGKYLVDGFRETTGWHSPPDFILQFMRDAGLAAEDGSISVSNIMSSIGGNWGESLANGFGSFDLSSIGFDKIMELVNGLKSGEGNLMSEIMRLMGMMDQLTAYKSKISSSWAKDTGTMSDYEYQLRTEITKNNHAIDEQNNILKRANPNIKGGAEAIKNAKNEVSKLNDANKDLTNKLNGLLGKEVETKDATDNLTKSLGDLGEGGGKAAKGAKEAKDAVAEFYDMVEGAISLFDKYEEAEEMSTDELLSNMASQISGIANWSTKIQQLSTKGIDQGLLKKLADMGPQGEKYVNAFVKMTGEQLAQANKYYEQSLILPQHVTAQVYGSFAIAGANAKDGFVNGLQPDKIKEDGVAFAHNFLDGVQNFLGIHSPSTVMRDQVGKQVPAGMEQGITWPTVVHNLEVACIRVANKVVDAFGDKLVDSEEIIKIGRNVVAGIQMGVEDKGTQNSLFNTVRSLCQRVIQTAKSPQGFWEHSPSRVFYQIGSFVTEGLAKGISENTAMATNAMGRTSEEVIDQMRETINKAQEALIDGVDDPVIKPVLDLSEIENGSRELDSMLSRNQALNASRSFTNLQNGEWNRQSALLTATSDNTDVVGAIASVKEDIVSLKDAMTNIRMVLDTGTMVGAMTPMIDKELGMRKIYAGRGM